jgi:hypothetical protein
MIVQDASHAVFIMRKKLVTLKSFSTADPADELGLYGEVLVSRAR